jgi:hypothetical protein
MSISAYLCGFLPIMASTIFRRQWQAKSRKSQFDRQGCINVDTIRLLGEDRAHQHWVSDLLDHGRRPGQLRRRLQDRYLHVVDVEAAITGHGRDLALLDEVEQSGDRLPLFLEPLTWNRLFEKIENRRAELLIAAGALIQDSNTGSKWYIGF